MDSPVLIGRQTNGRAEGSLEIAFFSVILEQLGPCLGGESAIETTLERVLGFFLVMQTLRQLTEDFPLSKHQVTVAM